MLSRRDRGGHVSRRDPWWYRKWWRWRRVSGIGRAANAALLALGPSYGQTEHTGRSQFSIWIMKAFQGDGDGQDTPCPRDDTGPRETTLASFSAETNMAPPLKQNVRLHRPSLEKVLGHGWRMTRALPYLKGSIDRLSGIFPRISEHDAHFIARTVFWLSFASGVGTETSGTCSTRRLH